ncbi:MAG: recombination regulator RecX [Clostridia bacterium]|nr:recombination regulator RecX [Clostridia bacterium]
MAKITKVEPQKHNPERCNLYLDGEYVCGMSMLVVVQNQLLPGKEITQEKLLDMVFESEKENAFNYAVDYICKYVPSQKQMTHKLYEKDYSKRVVDYVIEKCKSYGYIDDEKYAQSYVFQNRKLKGKLKLKQELMLKGIDKQIIDTVLADYDEEDGCLILARKKALNKDLDDPKVYAQLVRFLQYRGYDWEQIKKSIDKVREKEDE